MVSTFNVIHVNPCSLECDRRLKSIWGQIMNCLGW